MSDIGIAVVGYGMGAHHCKLIRQVPEFELKAVCDVDPVRRAAAESDLAVTTCADLAQVLGDNTIDAVVLAVPHHLHAPLTVQALQAGKHVVVEKVMCLTTAEADEMIGAARRAGRVLTVFQNRRGDGDFLTVRKVMQDGILGDVYQVECACNYRGPQSGWRTRKAYGGGYLYDAGAHMIDQLVVLAGCRATTVFASLQRRVWTDTMDTETYAHVIVRFENGLVGVVDISGLAWHRKPRFLLLGERGTFVGTADPDFGKLSSAQIKTEVVGLPSTIKVEPLLREDGKLYYRRLADHLLKGAELSVAPQQVRESVKIIEAALASSEMGRSIDLAGEGHASEW